MKSERTIQLNYSSSGAPPLSSTTPYRLFTRQSHKLGAVATMAFADLKTMLHHEVQVPHPDHIVEMLLQRRASLKEESVRKIAELQATVKKSNEVLARALNITLFTDEVIVDRTKITIIKRHSFWSTDIISIQIEDVLNVSASVGILFGSLSIASRVMNTTDHFDVNLLWRKDAIELQHIIQGYVIAKHSNIDMSELPCETMVETLRELGQDSGK